jgi:Co/Zn/Cd efflux system component
VDGRVKPSQGDKGNAKIGAIAWQGPCIDKDRVPDPAPQSSSAGLHRAVALVAALNLGYFGIEFAVALSIGSVSLFADSVDFLEDTAVNLLILVALGWSARRRALLGMALAAILLAPGVATLWTAYQKLALPIPPAPLPLSLAGLGALAVNLFCAVTLARYRAHRGSLTRAAFLSARNDALANVAIIAAGLLTAATASLWPDLLVGLGIFAMNLDAAREVLEAARAERREALAEP